VPSPSLVEKSSPVICRLVATACAVQADTYALLLLFFTLRRNTSKHVDCRGDEYRHDSPRLSFSVHTSAHTPRRSRRLNRTKSDRRGGLSRVPETGSSFVCRDRRLLIMVLGTGDYDFENALRSTVYSDELGFESVRDSVSFRF